MPIRSHYNVDKEILMIILEGKIELPELDDLYQNIVSSEEHPPDARSIWDFSKADFSVINRSFMEGVFNIRKKYPERGSAKAAFIATDDFSYGMSRMYETLSSFVLPQYIQIFRDNSEAEEWIVYEGPPKQK